MSEPPAAESPGPDPHPLAGLRSYAELRDAARPCEDAGPTHRLAVVADTNVEHYCVALRGEAAYRALPLAVMDCGAGDVERSVMVSTSDLNTFAADTVVIWYSSQFIQRAFRGTPTHDRPRFARHFVDQLHTLVGALASRS